MTTASPKAFISHASEDKDRFVLPLATELRANGIDAWVDRWEMQGGDSLIRRIFDEGIGQAAAIIVVVSATSVTKPWVREELDAAVVRRIQEQTRLIPVILDDATPPPAIAHLLHYNVNQLGFQDTLQQVLRTLYGQSERPPIGQAPAFVSSPTARAITGDPIDDLVLHEVLQSVRGMTPNMLMFDNTARENVCAQGVTEHSYYESLEALIADYKVRAKPMAGRKRFQLEGVSDRIWLDDEATRGTRLRSPPTRRAGGTSQRRSKGRRLVQLRRSALAH